jgi:HAMP domain-containing protein
MKLAQKLLLIIFVGFLLSTIVEAWFTFNQTKSALEQSIQIQQMELARQTMDKIDRFLYERLNDIQSIATDTVIQSFLQNFQKQNPTEINHRISDLSVLTGPWDELLLVDKTGLISASTNEKNIGKSINLETENNKSYQEALTRSQTYYSDVVFSDNSHKPTMIFAVPVRNEQDPQRPIIGVVLGNLAWPVPLEILQSTKVEVIELFNSKGVEIGDNIYENMDQILKDDLSGNPVVMKALTGQEGSTIVKSVEDNSESLTSYISEKGYLSYKGNNWVMIIESPAKQAFAKAFSTALSILLTFIPVIVIASLILLFFISITLRPIRLLTQVTKEIAAGNLHKQLIIKSKDEIGELGSSFNQMAVKLKEYQESLEHKITERTGQLEIAKNELQQKLVEVERMNNLMVNRELKMIDLKKQIADLQKQIEGMKKS